MAKLEDTLSRFFGGDDCGFNSGILIVIAIVFLLLATNIFDDIFDDDSCLLYTSPSPRDLSTSRMPSSA